MKRLITLPAAALVVSCAGPSDTGGYGQAYRAMVTGLKPTKNVAVYVARSQDEAKSLESQFLARTSEWKIVGSSSIYGQYCDVSKIQELGRSKGADIACVYIAPSGTIKRKVSYYGYHPPSPYGYGYGYNPPVQPYQVAPPQGGLMESVMQVQEYNRRVRQQNETKQIEDSKWAQVVVFLKRATPN